MGNIVLKSPAWLYLRQFISSPSFFVPPTLGLLGAITYALVVDELYSSSAIVIPVEQERSAGALAQLAGNFSNIAGLIGGTLSSEANERNLQIMKSRRIGELFIERMGLLPHLFPERWDADNEQWLPEKGPLFGLLPTGPDVNERPSMWFAFKRLEDLRIIQPDELSGTIKVTYSFNDPEFAKKVTSEFIDFVNMYIRERDRINVDHNIKFLLEKIKEMPGVPLTEALSIVAQDQIEKRMFIEARKDYAFEVVDYPVVEEEPSRPKILLALVIGVFGGVFFGIFLTLFLSTLGEKEQL